MSDQEIQGTTSDVNECSGSRNCYTAGPWNVKRNFSNGCEVCPDIYSDDGKWVARVVGAPHVVGEQPTGANANLVAAAPDLLEAVEAMLEEYEDGRNIQPFEIREMCRRAKYKAYGETYG